MALILLSAIWGSSFLFIKLSINSVPPSLLTFYRLLIASIFLYFFCNRLTIKKILSDNKKLLLGIAVFGNVLPFNLISFSEIYIDSIIAATLIGTMPLFTFLISYFYFKNHKLKFLSFIGLLLGFFGMVVFINPSTLSIKSNTVNFSLLIILASFFYGMSANLVKKINNHSPFEIATFSTILATIISFPIFVIDLYTSASIKNFSFVNITMISFLSATVLGVVCTGLAILIFFNLIKIKSAIFASQSNYLIPCFGSLWGFLFLDESLSKNMLYGLLLIVIGGWMVNRSMISR